MLTIYEATLLYVCLLCVVCLFVQDARYNLLKLRPSQQSSWVGYALAYYLLKDYDMALKVISEYRKTMTVVSY